MSAVPTHNASDYDSMQNGTANGPENLYNDTGIPVWLRVSLVVIGLTLNCINIKVFRNQDMKSSIYTMLGALEAISILVYLTFVPELSFEFFPNFNASYTAKILDTANTTLKQAAVFTSNWVTLSIAVCRWISVTFPLKVEQMCCRGNVLKCLSSIGALTILVFVTMPFVFAWDEQAFQVDQNSTGAFPVDLFNVNNKSILVKVALGCALLGTFIPVFGLLVVSVMIAVSLGRAKASVGCHAALESFCQERKTTLTLLSMAGTFMLAYIPGSVIDVLTGVFGVTGIDDIPVTKFVKSRLQICVCNASTFVFYCLMCEKFRGILKCWMQCAVKKCPGISLKTKSSVEKCISSSLGQNNSNGKA